MSAHPNLNAYADRLIAAHDNATLIAPLSAADATLDVETAYAILAEIERRRCDQGWRPVGRKIGFTNRTIWPRYGVYLPMWARTWAHTVHLEPNNRASLSLAGLV